MPSKSDAPQYISLTAGEPAPWFEARSTSNPRYVFDTAAGRYIVLCFFGSAGDPRARGALEVVARHRDLFDDQRAMFFGVSLDPQDEAVPRLVAALPGIRFFWDFDGAVSRAYGAIPADAVSGAGVPVRRFWMILDPTLRIEAVVPFAADGSDRAAVIAHLTALPPPDRFAGVPLQAPVLYLPRVFEPELCRALIDVYARHGGTESGFMRQVDGRTVGVSDPAHKRRRDAPVEDPELMRTIQNRIARRVVPEIAKVHQFHVTRIERYIVACYDTEDGGHFRAHRDNTTKGTAHRRFAVSINLNAEFEGGEISFPEYGPRTFKPPPGAAVVFSCSLLHAVSRVTRGRRFAYLPFLYDDAAAAVRQANLRHLAPDGASGAATEA